jgi:hypothetical protein
LVSEPSAVVLRVGVLLAASPRWPSSMRKTAVGSNW